MKVAIIGGGASGLMCASFLKRNNSKIDITIYEKNKGLGRKILASGNGKCNFMNYKATIFDYNSPLFVKKIFENTNKEDVLNYFAGMGLLFKFDEEGRLYPQSDSSETILKLLVDDLKAVNIKLETEVKNVNLKNNKVIINNHDIYDYALFSTGSSASILPQKAQNIYKYYEELNLKFEALKPVLVGLKVKNRINKLQGYRAKCVISYDGIENYEEKGEVIFKGDGVSGICIMNASRYFKNNSTLKIDLLPASSKDEIIYAINKRKEINNNPHYYLDGICHPDD